MKIDPQNVQYFDVDYDDIRLDQLPDGVTGIIERVNRKIAAKASLDELMNFLFDETKAISNCDRIALAFVQEEGRRVVVHWCRADYKPLVLDVGYTEDLLKNTLSEVIDKRCVRLINDLIQYVFVYPNNRAIKLLLEEGVRSSMTCPLVVDGKTIGLLIYNSRKAYTFDKQQVLQHLAIAERLSQAVGHVYRMDQLAQANTNYIELLSFISHELKSPLSSIIMDSNLLIEGYLGELGPKQQKKIARINIKADYLLNLVRDYLDLTRIEGGDLKLNIASNVDLLKDVLQPAIDLADVQLRDRDMNLTVIPNDGTLMIEADPSLLKIAVNNLLSNAVKYGRWRGDIKVRFELGDGKLKLSVYNEGIGWTEKQHTNLFHKFSRLDSSETRKQRGTGVGLYTTWRIVGLHGGEITATSQHGQWAKFVIEIPQPLELHRDSDVNGGGEA